MTNQIILDAGFKAAKVASVAHFRVQIIGQPLVSPLMPHKPIFNRSLVVAVDALEQPVDSATVLQHVALVVVTEVGGKRTMVAMITLFGRIVGRIVGRVVG